MADFVRMQQDVTSSLARRFVAVLRNWRPQPGTRAAQVADELRRWDGVLAADSRAALVYEVWMTHLPAAMGRASGGADVEGVLRALETQPNARGAAKVPRRRARTDCTASGRADETAWQWGKLHQLLLAHPLGKSEYQLGPVPRPGDSNTVNATSGANFRQTNGASWREILDVGDWDRSVMTNVPESRATPPANTTATCLQTGPPGNTTRCPSPERPWKRRRRNESCWSRENLWGTNEYESETERANSCFHFAARSIATAKITKTTPWHDQAPPKSSWRRLTRSARARWTRLLAMSSKAVWGQCAGLLVLWAILNSYAQTQNVACRRRRHWAVHIWQMALRRDRVTTSSLVSRWALIAALESL